MRSFIHSQLDTILTFPDSQSSTFAGMIQVQPSKTTPIHTRDYAI
ncbi:hypothetical protein GCM10008022_00340 [Paenibacillus hunanensis]|uniref:Uncharacterized protein n=1 Tax=Paenibacillus hunanensis TaxID=539262 RepID=A0ABU1J1B7_9BACL|nr:hypothetical protein [Paenibacillus hunanensis]GGI95797.1 hypothetical protein GCM10008022_00340 [Paenibacillus hunanensis]